jgi:hypothetical protein
MKSMHRALVFPPVVASALAAAAVALSATGAPPVTYQWQQPGTAPVTTPFAQPPAWIPLAELPATPAAAAGGYQWQQPGTAPVTTPSAQPPVWIPLAELPAAPASASSGYQWQQPATAPVTTPSAQPALSV